MQKRMSIAMNMPIIILQQKLKFFIRFFCPYLFIHPPKGFVNPFMENPVKSDYSFLLQSRILTAVTGFP